MINPVRSRGAFFSLLAATAVLALFAAAAFLSRNAIERNADFQRALRVAQVDRSRLVRLQLDEETGMRGYMATRAAVFLQPYRSSRLAFSAAAAALARDMAALGPGDTHVAQEERINAQWLRDVAEPAIADPATGSRYTLQLRGKQLVDAFRAQDAALSDELDRIADQAELRTSRQIANTLSWSLATGVALAVILLCVSFVQQRLERELEEQRHAYLEEKRVADALQEAFLRKELPELAKADLHGVYVPAGLEAKVGGDWYDAFELNDNRILFSIGDVAGHGIDAAVIMSRVRQAVLSVGVEERDPAKVLARANEILLLQDVTIVTAVCGMIDLAHSVITVANAGHPAPILLHANGQTEMLKAGGPPLGALDRPSYASHTTMIDTGSLLVLYTDGVIEYGRDWERGEAKLIEAIRSVKSGGVLDPAASIMQAIFGNEPPVDDVAILTITFRDADASPQPMAADVATASARPILDRSARTLIQSIGSAS
jgi:serine phosphatase RsbU (regulator of sigma subunit)